MRSGSLPLFLLLPVAGAAQDPALYPDPPAGAPPVSALPEAEAGSEAEMRPYVEPIGTTGVSFGMVPITGGRFRMGSPDDEPGRGADEGPPHEVRVSPFWMGKHEVTWDEYHLFMLKMDRELRERGELEATPQDAWADAVSRPTPPYAPMDFEMGVEGHPAICMTQFAAKQYTKWLSMRTGRFYRLPTEAEWEYACRAGTQTAYSFGSDPAGLDAHAWYGVNSDFAYRPVGRKEPNPWGLFDMHGNVAEWVLDRLGPAYEDEPTGSEVLDPVAWPTKLFPRVVRGGSWLDDPEELRSAARRGSGGAWQMQDPQLPKSIWYHTDAAFVGFRVVRPLAEPSDEERRRAWDPDLDSLRKIYERQRQGGR